MEYSIPNDPRVIRHDRAFIEEAAGAQRNTEIAISKLYVPQGASCTLAVAGKSTKYSEGAHNFAGDLILLMRTDVFEITKTPVDAEIRCDFVSVQAEG